MANAKASHSDRSTPVEDTPALSLVKSTPVDFIQESPAMKSAAVDFITGIALERSTDYSPTGGGRFGYLRLKEEPEIYKFLKKSKATGENLSLFCVNNSDKNQLFVK